MITNIIAWMVIGLGIAALWHAVYEVILLPTLRQSIRFKFFALRDSLRVFKADCGSQCSDETFHMLDDQLSWAMDNLPKLTFSLLHESTRVLNRNTELREEVARRLAILNACKLNEYVGLRKEAAKLTLRTLALNSGGWFIYLIPIAYPAIWWDSLKKKVQRLSVFPETEFNHLSTCAA